MLKNLLVYIIKEISINGIFLIICGKILKKVKGDFIEKIFKAIISFYFYKFMHSLLFFCG